LAGIDGFGDAVVEYFDVRLVVKASIGKGAGECRIVLASG
jgi:hypothetical protein